MGEGGVLSVEGALECFIGRRLNRFVVEVLVGEVASRAHINNTGRLLDLLVEGRRGFCTVKESGKTRYRLFAVEDRGVGAVIDTQLQMRVFEAWLSSGLIPWLKGWTISRRNVRLGGSVIDYLLRRGDESVYVELKSAVLRSGEHAMYPDCPSLRGRRHVEELTRHAASGGRSLIVFMAALPEINSFKLNAPADAELHKLLLKAEKAGVEVRAIASYYDPSTSSMRLYNPDLKAII